MSRTRVKAAFLAAAITDDRTERGGCCLVRLLRQMPTFARKQQGPANRLFWIVLGFIAVLQAAVSRCRSAT